MRKNVSKPELVLRIPACKAQMAWSVILLLVPTFSQNEDTSKTESSAMVVVVAAAVDGRKVATLLKVDHNVERWESGCGLAESESVQIERR